MIRFSNVILSLAATVSLIAGAGCSKKTAKATTVAAPVAEKPAASSTKTTAATTGEAAVTVDDPSAPPAGPIYFELDSSTLTADSRDVLATFAAWAVAHKPAIKIEGHTDEQGTDEYNLALGDRRARAVADYLIDLGVDPTKVDTITYGEERPAQDGSDEDDYAANRRGEVKTN
jgi:peptidoglycan-associated lipoprotein